MATSLALLASLLWGTADFLGGTAARRLAATTVVAISQAFALAGLVVVALATSAFGADTGYIGWALAAAVIGVIALSCFYAALASGTMGVVAPIAAVGVIVPVAVGVGEGDRPGALQAVGVLLAFAGVFLAAGPQRDEDGARASRRPLVLAAVAAAGFGSVLVCVAHGARSSTVMTLLTMRATSVVLLGVLALAGRAAFTARPRDLPLLAAIGAGDVGANAAMAVASTHGLLSVVAVLSSLYPAVTVVLARIVHAERLTAVQAAGVLAALAGVSMIASGGGVG
ncbi:MAG TPA: EamA family transporter [Mycobacteriales bacterium]|jgi:drug/metabolite transporter (DMT)-like permease|nr:EamA family transporter [Mycobacteriales bacterium]